MSSNLIAFSAHSSSIGSLSFYKIYEIENSIFPIIKVWGGVKIYINKKLLAYIRYIRQEDAINGLYGVDSTEIKVLNAIVLLLADKKEGKVGDLLALEDIASPATIHTVLKKLTKKNLITFRQATDSVAKYVELTELGLKRFNDLAKAITK